METVETMTDCPWPNGDPLYQAYHDDEWGKPVHDDQKLFEFLILEGAQAGLAWITILRKRKEYRRAFASFNPRVVARYDARKVEELMQNPGIVRNRLKIESAITNAAAFLAVQKELGSFDRYLWSFTAGEQIRNNPKTMQDVPATTRLSEEISKDLKRRGFRFVGPTIIYAYLQAVGVVNDHLVGCAAKHVSGNDI